MKQATMYFDGASRGNPGIASGGGVIIMADSHIEFGSVLESATNNEAEYHGLLSGLEKAIELGIESLKVFGDSQLVVNQVNHLWSVKSPNLLPIYSKVQSIKKQFLWFEISWVRRTENAIADKVCNKLLDQVKVAA